MTYKEIARRLEISEKAAKAAGERAQYKLRRILRERQDLWDLLNMLDETRSQRLTVREFKR